MVLYTGRPHPLCEQLYRKKSFLSSLKDKRIHSFVCWLVGLVKFLVNVSSLKIFLQNEKKPIFKLTSVDYR